MYFQLYMNLAYTLSPLLPLMIPMWEKSSSEKVNILQETYKKPHNIILRKKELPIP